MGAWVRNIPDESLEIKTKAILKWNHAVPAFGYWSAPVKKGTKVVCSIKKWAKGNKDIEVRIDSVDDERAA